MPGSGHDIVEGRQVFDQFEMLMDHTDPLGHGIAWRAENDAFTMDGDFTGIRLVNPGEDVHQGRFAGAIFPEQGMDLPGRHREADVLVGFDRGKGLADSAHLNRGDGFHVCHTYSCKVIKPGLYRRQSGTGQADSQGIRGKGSFQAGIPGREGSEASGPPARNWLTWLRRHLRRTSPWPSGHPCSGMRQRRHVRHRYCP